MSGKVKNRVLSRDSLAYKLLNFKEMSAVVPIIVLLIIGIATVSYTHLDVYKRQIW